MMVLRDCVAAGGSLADAMREQPDVFDNLSVHMVEVGGILGTLDASTGTSLFARSDSLDR
jgi:type II secretory pathway component PulF